MGFPFKFEKKIEIKISKLVKIILEISKIPSIIIAQYHSNLIFIKHSDTSLKRTLSMKNVFVITPPISYFFGQIFKKKKFIMESEYNTKNVQLILAHWLYRKIYSARKPQTPGHRFVLITY